MTGQLVVGVILGVTYHAYGTAAALAVAIIAAIVAINVHFLRTIRRDRSRP